MMETKVYKLRELVSLQIGYPFQSENFVQEGCPVIRPADISDQIQSTEETIKTANLKRFEKFTVKKGDILISLMGVSVGKTFIYSFNENGFYNQYVGYFNLEKKNLLLSEYLYLYLQGIQKNILQNFSETNPAPLTTKVFIESCSIRLPSLKDQAQIVDIYNRSRKLVTKRSKSLQLCDLLSQSLFLETRKYNEIAYPFNKIIEVQTNLKIFDSSENVDLPFITPNNIVATSGTIRESKQTQNSKSINSKFYFTEDHILFARKFADLNKVATPDFKGFCNTNIYPILVDKKVANKHYIKFALLSHDFQNFTMSFIRSSRVPSLNRSVIYNYIIKLPSKKIQEKFAERVLKIEKLRTSLEHSFVSMQAIESMIVHKVMKGEFCFNEVDLENIIHFETQSDEDPTLNKINKSIENYHVSLPHTGAPPEIDNLIRQLDTELRFKGDIPFTENYVKYRIIRDKFQHSFTFKDLWKELTVFPFETIPSYDEVYNLLFCWLKDEAPFVRQQFNNKTKQIEIIINEIA